LLYHGGEHGGGWRGECYVSVDGADMRGREWRGVEESREREILRRWKKDVIPFVVLLSTLEFRLDDP